MKKRKVLSLALALAMTLALLPTAANALITEESVECIGEEGEIFYFDAATGSIEGYDEGLLKEYDDDGFLTVKIPSAFGGYPVTAIGNGAFMKYYGIARVYVPEGVTDIGNYAFNYCWDLEEIYLPASLKSVGTKAFRKTNLKLIHYAGSQAQWRKISVGADNGTFVNDMVEYNAEYTAGPSLDVPEELFGDLPAPEVSTAPSPAPSDPPASPLADFPAGSPAEDFEITDGVLVKYTGAGGNVVVPSGVVKIGSHAFQGGSLTGVRIPGSVEVIENDAFSYHPNLTTVIMEEGVKEIGESAFMECGALTQVSIPSTVLEIGGSAFWHTPWQENQEDLVIVNDMVIEYQGVEKTVTIPKGVKKICRAAFYGDYLLERVDLPDGLVEIGASAFAKCSSLNHVVLPDSVKTIGENAFYWCDRLHDLTIPAGVSWVGNSALNSTAWFEAQSGDFILAGQCLLRYQGSDTAVQVPDPVTMIADGAFQGSAVHTVDLPEGVQTIDDHAFDSCAELTSADLPEGLQSIGDHAFASCGKLTSVRIPDSVTSIGEGAFSGCAALKSIHIPSGVSVIPSYAFGNCTSLESVVLPNTVNQLGYHAFADCTCLSTVVLSNRLTSLGSFVFENCRNLKRVTIPAGVTTIGSPGFDGDIFQGCTDLTICGQPGSEAETFANRYHYAFESIAAPAPSTAYASTQSVQVDGKSVTFQCYALKDANGNDTNYIKLRDLADILNGSPAQFQVGWDGSVTITTGAAYIPNGSEQSTPFSGDRTYSETDAATKVNGQTAQLAAFVLNDDNGGGYTYYQLRDLGKTLGFNVGWSADKGMFVETDKPYDPNN